MSSCFVAYDPQRDEVSFEYSYTKLRYLRKRGKWKRDYWYMIKAMIKRCLRFLLKEDL